jgi:hypothetical protein
VRRGAGARKGGFRDGLGELAHRLHGDTPIDWRRLQGARLAVTPHAVAGIELIPGSVLRAAAVMVCR